MNFPYNNIGQWWSALIIDQMVKSGFKDFFCCPGMRNAPLLYAIETNPDTKVHQGFDERAQSYHALGFIKTTKKPAILVCTSGTAVANFLPAIIEAEKNHLPLIVISADRPSELNAADANQTINQVEVLRNYTKSFWDTSEAQASYPPAALAGKIAFLLNQSLENPSGPLHINVPLREPLDHTIQEIQSSWKNEAISILKNDEPCLLFAQTKKNVDKDDIKKLHEKLKVAKRPLIIFGPPHGLQSYDREKIKLFIKNYNGSFSCDVTSGIKYCFGSEDGLIPTLDHPEVLHQLESKSPDLIVHFGGRLTSKHYYPFLNKIKKGSTQKNIPIILISDGAYHEDPGFSFNQRWNLRPSEVINELALLFHENSSELKPLVDWEELIKTKRTIIESAGITYPFITKRAVDTLDNVKKAFIGNSTFIRSFDSYAGTYSAESNWDVIANRGASGIEGHIAMSFAVANNTEDPTVSFIGDISFLYDLNSLSYFKDKEIPFLCIIANNKSGGIFNLLPIAQDDQAKTYKHLLTTPHNHDITALIKAFGLNSSKVSSKEEYQKHLDKWKKDPQLKFLEVCFDDRENQDIYKKLRTVKL